MVEAAGIEPASESTTPRHLHVQSIYLILDEEPPVDRLLIVPSPFLSPRIQGKYPEPSLLSDAIPETQALSR